MDYSNKGWTGFKIVRISGFKLGLIMDTKSLVSSISA